MGVREESYVALTKAVQIAGGQAPFARLIGCTQGAVWQMLRDKRPLSPRYVLKAEAGTGVLKEKLRPDIYRPEDAQAPRPSKFEAAR